MKSALLILSLTLVLLGCKKGEHSGEYWNQKANETYNKIIALSENYVCSDISKLNIKNIGYPCPSYVLIHNKDTAAFNQLIKSFTYFQQKAQESGLAMDILCLQDFYFKISCKENKPYLVTLNNIELADINMEMPRLYAEIKNYYNNSPCTNPDDWQGITLYSGETQEALAVKKTDGDFYRKVQTYNQLNCKKLVLEGKQCPSFQGNKIIIKCENNTAKAAFE